jgi:thiosulfate dehydrogenase [quinone] large subunit
MKCNKEQYIWALLRLGLGWIFLWAFLDKLFGFGFATSSDKAWIVGGSPTYGFLKFATHGPLTSFYQNLAGSAIVDWLFMLGLLFVGLSLTLGILVKIGGYIGVLMLVLIYSAGFLPPKYNPFIDKHIIFAVIMIGLTMVHSGQCLGLGKWWFGTKLVQKYRLLE